MERIALGIVTVVLGLLAAIIYWAPEMIVSLAADMDSQSEIADIVASASHDSEPRSGARPSATNVGPSTSIYGRSSSAGLGTDNTSASLQEMTRSKGNGRRPPTSRGRKPTTSTTSPPTTTAAPPTTTATPPTTAPPTSTSTITEASTSTMPGVPTDAVYIAAGQSIQAAVEKHREGTTFVIGAGIHSKQQVSPRIGNRFIGESGAVLDGAGSAAYAFGGGGDDVTIEGLEIRNYAAPMRDAVVKSSAGRWLVKDNEIHSNRGIGVSAARGWRVIGNKIHHNQQYGIRAFGSGIEIAGNEIAYNNANLEVNPYDNGGGSKFIDTVGLVLRNNHVHHNGGPGLWTDGDNIDTVFDGNMVENNHHAGIKHEISCRATIKNNTVVGNGFGNPSWLAGAGIVVLNSPDVTVSGNVVQGNADGIAGIQSTRSSNLNGDHCRRELKNLKVSGNTIAMKEGYTGIVTNDSDAVFNSWNNQFTSNTYQIDPNKGFFKWAGATLTLNEWKELGMG
jgi:parallel beta-helix repeat protein